MNAKEEDNDEFTSDEIFLTFVRLRNLCESIDGKIDTKYIEMFVKQDLSNQIKLRKINKKHLGE